MYRTRKVRQLNSVPVVKFLTIMFLIIIYFSLLQILVCITLYLCPISMVSIVLAECYVRRV